MKVTSGDISAIRSWRNHAGLAILTSMVVLALLWTKCVPPWDGYYDSFISGHFMLPEIRSFEAAGWWELRGIPHLGTIPTDPPSGLAYTHHSPGWPALLYAFYELLGGARQNLRLLPALATAASAGLLAYWMMRRGMPVIPTLLIIVSRPVLFLYGTMASAEPSLCFLFVLGTWLDDMRREGKSWSRPALLLVVFVAPWFDWQGIFLVPAIYIRTTIETRRFTATRFEVLSAIAGGLSLSALLGWLGHAVLHLNEVNRSIYGVPLDANLPSGIFSCGIHHVLTIATKSSLHPLSMDAVDWAAKIASNAAHLLVPGVIVGAWAILPTPTEERTRIAALATPGLLNIAVFRWHAAADEFWVMHLGPAAAWICVSVVASLSRVGAIRTTIALFIAGLAAVHTIDATRNARAYIPLLEAYSQNLARVVRPATATVLTFPLVVGTYALDGHVLHIDVAGALRIVDMSRDGRLTDPIDIVVPATEWARSRLSGLPPGINVVEVPLRWKVEHREKGIEFFNSDSLFRIEVPRRLE